MYMNTFNSMSYRRGKLKKMNIKKQDDKLFLNFKSIIKNLKDKL